MLYKHIQMNKTTLFNSIYLAFSVLFSTFLLKKNVILNLTIIKRTLFLVTKIWNQKQQGVRGWGRGEELRKTI